MLIADYRPGNFPGTQRCSVWSILLGKPTLYFMYGLKRGQLVAGTGVEAGTRLSSPPVCTLVVFSQINKSHDFQGDGSDNLGIM